MVGLGPLHRLPSGSRVERYESGQVWRPQAFLGHSISELAGKVDPSQTGHSVEVGKVGLNLDYRRNCFNPVAFMLTSVETLF